MANKQKRAYIVGIKGVAMAALSVYFKERGMYVTGSDVPEVFPTDAELEKAKIPIVTGFDPQHVDEAKPDVVYYTGAHGGRDNPEVQRARELGIPAYPHGKGLGLLMEHTRQIVVAGSHGKTTTSAMIATLLSKGGKDPSYAIGCGTISGGKAAGHYGKSDWFVAEGDEYVTDPGHDKTPRFLWLAPEILIVTNIDFDHPDAYRDLSAVQQAFRSLQEKSGYTVYNADDKNSRIFADAGQCQTYGFSPASDVRISHVGFGKGRTFFTLEERGVMIGEFTLRVPGRHNVLNATAAGIAAHTAGMEWEEIREGLLSFTGTKRRFEFLAAVGGIRVYDDYAHHPAEIRATLRAARDWYPDAHITAVFQPHTYSRTKALLSEFSRAFSDCDTVIFSDIYASAREHDTLGIDGRVLAQETAAHHKHVLYGKTPADVSEHAVRSAKSGDIIVCMGAGDIFTWEQDIVNALRERYTS